MNRHIKDPMKFVFIAMLLFVSALPLFAQGHVTMIEADRITSQTDGAVFLPSLPVSPISDASSGAPAIFQASQLESSSFVIQAVPEPSSLALIGTALALTAVFRKGSAFTDK